MKKLMTMIATVAMSFGLFAAGTFTNKVDFTSATNENPYVTGDSLWAYSVTNNGEATSILADEVQVLDEQLVLATGQKVLARKFAAAPVAIGEGLFADMVLDLNGEALDEVPDVAGAKIALFALDGTEVAGLPNETNVYVYAAYGTAGGKALFLLKSDAEEFIGSARRIAVKSYASVVSGDTRAGFLIYSGAGASSEIDTVVEVKEVYTFDGTQWNKQQLTDQAGSYLGGLQINPSYSKWISAAHASLFVSMDDSALGYAKLASIDFQGRGKITSITLTDDDPGFPADNATMAIAATDAAVTAVEGNGAFLVGDPAEGISMPVANVVTATVETTKGNITITGANATKIAEGKYEFMLEDKGTLTVRGWDAAATVDGEPCETIAEAIKKANDKEAACELVLNGEWVMTADTETEKFTSEVGITLDLAGNAITCSSDGEYAETIQNYGILTIIDTKGDGSVSAGTGTYAAAVGNYGTLTIENGIFNGLVYADEAIATTITGGSFDKASNGADEFALKDAVPEEGYEIVDTVKDDYWTVKEEEIKTGTVIFICEKTAFTNELKDVVVGTPITFPTVADYETATTIGKGWYEDQEFETPVVGDKTVVEGKTTYWAKAVDAVATVESGTDTFKFEDVATALAKVQELEQAEGFPITVTAIADGLVVTDPAGTDSITLAKDATVVITADGWAFTGDVEGEVTLAAGKSITVPTGLTNFKVNAPDGYAVVPQATMDTVTYTVAQYVAQINETETKYTTLAAAVAEVTADQTITLLNTVTLDAQLLLNKGFAFTIDGNGQTITSAGLSAVAEAIKVTGVGTVVTFNGVTFDDIDCAGCVIHGDRDGTFVLTNCTFTNCDVVKGTAGHARIVYCINLAGGYTISGCTFEDNTSEGCIVGHNLSNGGSVVLIENTLFKNNTYADVGLFYVTGSNAENCQIIGNTFEGNKVPAEYAGKASILYASCAITIKDNLFKDNVFATTATGSKVGVIVLGSKAIGSIVNNNAFVGSDYTGVAAGQNYGDIFTGTAANIDGNYFNGGAAPTYGTGKNVYQDENVGTIAATYLESYTAQADGCGIETGTPVADTTVATLTITKGENVTAVVVTNADGAVVTNIPVSATAVGAHFFIADAMTVEVDLENTTFAENYELDEANSTLTATMTGDATITVNAKLVEFAITFTDADEWTNVVSTAYGATPAPTEQVPAKTGYTFKGWDAEIVPATAAATYTAVYTANVYTVTFEKGAADGGTDVAPITFSYGEEKTAPACDWTYTDHEFVAWTNLVAGGAAIAEGDPLPTEVEADYTLTALWAEKAAPAPTPVEPGEDIKPDAGDDVTTINTDPTTKAKYLKAPGGVETDATYLSCFNAVAGDTDGTVKFVLNATGSNEVVKAEGVAGSNALEKVLAATGDSTTLKLDDAQVLKGFFYSLKQGAVLKSIDFKSGDKNKLGGRDDIEFTLDKPATSGFYQMIVTPTPVQTTMGTKEDPLLEGTGGSTIFGD